MAREGPFSGRNTTDRVAAELGEPHASVGTGGNAEGMLAAVIPVVSSVTTPAVVNSATLPRPAPAGPALARPSCPEGRANRGRSVGCSPWRRQIGAHWPARARKF